MKEDASFRNLEWRSWLLGLIAFLVGALLLVVSDSFEPPVSILFAHVGSFVLAAIASAAILQFWQVKHLTREIWRNAEAAESLRQGGVTKFTTDFQHSVDWDRLFRESTSLNAVFTYANRWRGWHREQLRRLVDDEDGTLRVVMPDPRCDPAIVGMAHRFGESPDWLRENIGEAQEFFGRLGDTSTGRVEIYAYSADLTLSFYRFQTECVIATFNYQRERGRVITFTCRRGGSLYDWTGDQWSAIVDDGCESGITRLVYSNRGS